MTRQIILEELEGTRFQIRYEHRCQVIEEPPDLSETSLGVAKTSEDEENSDVE